MKLRSSPIAPKVRKCIPKTPGLAIAYAPIATLKAHPSNARTHSTKQIRQISESIRAYGFTNPILIDKSKTIIAGHGRVAAAKLLGIGDVPTIRLEHLSPDQIRAYIIADNKLALNAGWDESILKVELQHLLNLDNEFDITLTGFEVPEIDIILQGELNEDPDDAQELLDAGEVVTRLGDMWQLGKHRITCGNALEASSFARLMGGARAHMVFVDPPYNVVIEGNVSGKGAIKHGDFAMASGEMDVAEFTQFLTVSFGHLVRHSISGSVHFVCMDWRHQREMLSAGDKTYDAFLNLCVWVKESGGQGSFYRSRHELIFVFRNGKEKSRNNIQLGKYGRYRTNVWEYSGVRGLSQQQGEEGNLLALHPTVKPVALIVDAILDCSARGNLILDSFLGSGSTLIAAEKTGRICYGIELNPVYVDTAVRRWQRYTGSNAISAKTGKSFDETASNKETHNA